LCCQHFFLSRLQSNLKKNTLLKFKDYFKSRRQFNKKRRFVIGIEDPISQGNRGLGNSLYKAGYCIYIYGKLVPGPKGEHFGEGGSSRQKIKNDYFKFEQKG